MVAMRAQGWGCGRLSCLSPVEPRLRAIEGRSLPMRRVVGANGRKKSGAGRAGRRDTHSVTIVIGTVPGCGRTRVTATQGLLLRAALACAAHLRLSAARSLAGRHGGTLVGASPRRWKLPTRPSLTLLARRSLCPERPARPSPRRSVGAAFVGFGRGQWPAPAWARHVTHNCTRARGHEHLVRKSEKAFCGLGAHLGLVESRVSVLKGLPRGVERCRRGVHCRVKCSLCRSNLEMGCDLQVAWGPW